jgi:hypothetical protein
MAEKVRMSRFFSFTQLCAGMNFVEKLKTETGRPGLKVAGWYHSHPRITVWCQSEQNYTSSSLTLQQIAAANSGHFFLAGLIFACKATLCVSDAYVARRQ